MAQAKPFMRLLFSHNDSVANSDDSLREILPVIPN